MIYLTAYILLGLFLLPANWHVSGRFIVAIGMTAIWPYWIAHVIANNYRSYLFDVRCGWCGEIVSRTCNLTNKFESKSKRLKEHFLHCESNPLVVENKRLRAVIKEYCKIHHTFCVCEWTQTSEYITGESHPTSTRFYHADDCPLKDSENERN